jgi:DNA-binding response OmpR family regulator
MSAHPSEPTAAAGEPEPVPLGSGAPLQPAAFARAKLDVLVVDDDQWTADALARFVRSFGHGCRVAPDGDEALRLLAGGQTNVVISDWDMPGMSGAELCKRIRSAANDAPYTYFIFLTGFDDREHLLAAMEAGADHYQRKPVDLDALEAQLVSAARLIELHRQLAVSSRRHPEHA